MTAQAVNVGQESAVGRRFLPLLLALFVGSGCAALIYEVVWLQSLQLVIGSSAVSLGVLLGTFMGGMCLGSLLFPRLVSARRHPLRAYALIELGIGIIGVALLFGLPHVNRLYAAHVGHGFTSVLMRGAIAALCLLPPTILMGATLPAIGRWVESTPRGVSWLGFFYGGNIAGGVVGCLLAGFYLLRVHDMAVATYVAAALNVAVALTALRLAARTSNEKRGHSGFSRPIGKKRGHSGFSTQLYGAENGPSGAENPECPRFSGGEDGSEIRLPRTENPECPRFWGGGGGVYVVIALSGACALGAEVVWTHILSLLLGGTVYTFSLILAVFLVGLGIGSGLGAALARRMTRPQVALGGCQLFLMGAIAWAAWGLGRWLPYWPVDPSLSASPWVTLQLDLTRCAWVVLPGAVLWGASFPLALASAASRGQDAGRLVGGVYAANTVGAILGALGFSMVLIPRTGSQGSQRIMIVLAGVAVLLVLASLLYARWVRGASMRHTVLWPVWAGLAGVPVLAGLLIWSVPPIPASLIAYGRYAATWGDAVGEVYVGEGMCSTVAVTMGDDGVMSFHVSGKVEASTEPQDMRLQRMLGHLSALMHPQPRSVLVVGCGAGVTAGTFTLHPGVERIVLCEIEPLIPRIAAEYFRKENYDIVNDPRVEIVYDDARHYVLTTQERFDVITSDPIHPWVKGSAALYTREYFELCKRRLNPGGVVTQWVPLYESTTEAIKSELATFFAAFPDGTIWSNDAKGAGYDIVLLGRTEPTPIDVDALQQRLDRDDHLRVAASLSDVAFDSAVDLLATYAGGGADLEVWLRGAQINTDRNLRLQYLAGLGLNANRRTHVFDEMRSHCTFPETLFIATPERKLQLRAAVDRP